MKTQLITVNGNPFPEFNGEPLSWSIGAYDTWNEAHAGYPRMRTVIQAMRDYRPEQLKAERYELLKASFGGMFGHVAKKQLAIVDSYLE